MSEKVCGWCDAVFKGVMVGVVFGILIGVFAGLLTACGRPEDPTGEHRHEHGEGGGGVPASDPAFAALQPTIAKNCGVCHNGREEKPIDSPARLKAAQSRIASGNMPPGGAIDSADKAALLSY